MNTLVSSVYTHLYKTKYGGRPRSFNKKFHEGLVNLKNNNYRKIIYCSPEDHDEVVKYLNDNLSESELQLYTTKVYKLTDFFLHDEVLNLQILNQMAETCQRSVHVQYMKFEFLQEAAKGHNGYTYWIDAGLITPGLFPDEIYNKPLDIIDQSFLDKLSERIGDKMYTIARDRSKPGPGQRLPEGYVDSKWHPVGGFFGGWNTAVLERVPAYYDTIHKWMKRGELLYEEMIMEFDFYDNTDKYLYDVFDTFYCASQSHWRTPIPGEKNFFKVFQR